jgi:AraC-like DNA-binding protein
MSLKHTYHYLTVTDDIRKHSLYVIGGGTTSVSAGLTYPPPDHPGHHLFRWHEGRILTEYQLVYITRGGGTLESKSGGTTSLIAGDLFMLFPDEWHRYSPSSRAGWDEHWVAFRGHRVQQIISELGICREQPVFRTEITSLLQREFVRIEDELAEASIGYQNIVAARIELILALAVASTLRSSLGTTDALQVIKRAKTLMVEHIDQQLNMEDVARELNVGYSWFRKTFRNFTGLSPGEYQLQVRITRASEFLRGSNLSIAEIGVLCGFESAYYFSRIFKKKTGVPPSEFRERSL